MAILLLLFIVLILFIFPGIKEKKVDCSYHFWVYRNKNKFEEYMVCDKCGRLPDGDYEESSR